jgi:hypothetical protein
MREKPTIDEVLAKIEDRLTAGKAPGLTKSDAALLHDVVMARLVPSSPEF